MLTTLEEKTELEFAVLPVVAATGDEDAFGDEENEDEDEMDGFGEVGEGLEDEDGEDEEEVLD